MLDARVTTAGLAAATDIAIRDNEADAMVPKGPSPRVSDVLTIGSYATALSAPEASAVIGILGVLTGLAGSANDGGDSQHFEHLQVGLNFALNAQGNRSSVNMAIRSDQEWMAQAAGVSIEEAYVGIDASDPWRQVGIDSMLATY